MGGLFQGLFDELGDIRLRWALPIEVGLSEVQKEITNAVSTAWPQLYLGQPQAACHENVGGIEA